MEILNFLLPINFPTYDIELLPATFFFLIFGLFSFTIIQVYRRAKPENWENNWYGGNKGDKGKKLDAEHGSVMDISHAVATSSERLADIMPGMILIIGLFGTFLGLGLALDKASGILSSANAMSNMDSSMAQLMGMLEGLGTKFKTSTWGLLVFILLKVILSKNGYEERRLRWSIEKVKSELDIVRDQNLKERRANNQKIIDCMQVIATQFDKSMQVNQSSNEQQLKRIADFGRDSALAIKLNHDAQVKLIDTVQHNHLEHIKVIENQQLSLENIMAGLSEKYDTMLANFELQHQESKSFLQSLVQQGKDTRDAMVSFIEKNEATVSNLGKSAAGISKAASTMGDSAHHLKDVIESFRMNMEQVVSLMKNDLNVTISGMNTSFGQNMGKMSNDLKSSIEDMSHSFKGNMSEMSQGLGMATKDISNAVNSLSVSVDKTMSDVTNTINKSMEMQTRSQNAFIESTEVLNEYVIQMTGLVNKLSGDITGGLKSVSDSNRNMINLAKKTEGLTDIVDNTFKESLQRIESVTTLKPALERLTFCIDSQIPILKKISDNTSNTANKKQKGNGFASPFGGNRK